MSEYPALSKLLPAPWFKSKMNCPKKVAFEYVAVNTRFQKAFAKHEKTIQDVIEEAMGELETFLDSNLSATAKTKIAIMSKAVKKESDEKKAKKAKDKYGVDIAGKGELKDLPAAEGDEEEGDESEMKEEVYEENDEKYQDKQKNSSDKSSNDRSSSSSGENQKRMTTEEELFGNRIESKRPMSIDTSSSSSTSSLSADVLTPTPKNTDVPLVHKKLLRFSKANMFGVFDKSGKSLSNEITIDSENKIHVSVQ